LQAIAFGDHADSSSKPCVNALNYREKEEVFNHPQNEDAGDGVNEREKEKEREREREREREIGRDKRRLRRRRRRRNSDLL
jgi:hypothetical protein